jgi:hypothetical protein
MSLDPQAAELPFFVKIETANGKTTTVPIAFMTRQQVETFLQTDFKRLVNEAGIKGARIFIERAQTADYQKVLQEVGESLRAAAGRAA